MGKSNVTKDRKRKIQDVLVENHNVTPENNNFSIPTYNQGNILPFDLTQKRLDEIQKLHKAMNDSIFSSSKRIFQTLPKQLRRRAASHNPNRVPRRHRMKSMNESLSIKNQSNPKSISFLSLKKRLRKRPRNLKQLMKKRLHIPLKHMPGATLGSRSEKTRWIETHYWHAKRFHMIPLWGFQLAGQNNHKVYRQVIRHAQKGILAQDISYEQTIRIRGNIDDVICFLEICVGAEPLKGIKVWRDSTDPSVYCSKRFLSNICNADNQPVCPVSCLFNANFTDKHADALLFIHPAAINETTIILSSILRQEIFTKLEMENISGKLNRFRLIGKRVFPILRQILKIQKDDKTDIGSTWQKISHGLKKESRLPENIVIPLFAEDPRLNFPPSDTELPVEPISKVDIDNVILSAHYPEHVNVVYQTLLSFLEHSQKPSDKVVRSVFTLRRTRIFGLDACEKPNFQPAFPSVPILLVRSSLTKSLPAFEILVPEGFAVDFWRSLIYANVAVSKDGPNNVFPIAQSEVRHIFETFFSPRNDFVGLKHFGFPYFSPSFVSRAFRDLLLDEFSLFTSKIDRSPKTLQLCEIQNLKLSSELAENQENCLLGKVSFWGRGTTSPYAQIYWPSYNHSIEASSVLIRLLSANQSSLAYDSTAYSVPSLVELDDQCQPVGILLPNRMSRLAFSTKFIGQSFNLLEGKPTAVGLLYSSIANELSNRSSAQLEYLNQLLKLLSLSSSESIGHTEHPFEQAALAGIRHLIQHLISSYDSVEAKANEFFCWIRHLHAPHIYYPILLTLER